MNTQNQITYKVGEVELSYKKRLQFPFHPIKSSDDASTIIRQIIPKSQINYREHFYAMYLTMRNEVVGYHLISVGGINHTMVDVRILLQGALLCNAVAICIFHNHPSTNTNPSSADMTLTKKIAEACKLIDLTLLDHIIITENDYYSFADNGKL
ncbi:MAG: JAB domain-containing protein [Flavobacteriaceae bacterium]|nr:JAB domain-containing protein [Flavobacteriaceae bacterium]